MVMGLTGGTLLPYATGVLGNAYGLRASLLIVPAALIALAALLSVMTWRLARAASPTA
jgi:fucose permease